MISSRMPEAISAGSHLPTDIICRKDGQRDRSERRVWKTLPVFLLCRIIITGVSQGKGDVAFAKTVKK